MQAADEFADIEDHALNVEFWEWDADKVRRCPLTTIDSLEQILTAAVADSQAELKANIEESSKLSALQRKRNAADSDLPRASKCRWFHMSGCSFEGIRCFCKHYNIKSEVEDALREAAQKPVCEWHQFPPGSTQAKDVSSDECFNHLFVAGHYLIEDPAPPGEAWEADGDVKGFHFEQAMMLYLPDLNTLLSVDGNGEKSWDAVSDLLPNERCFLRTGCDASTLIYKLIDAMIDGVYPLLDLYGDTIEGLEFVMMVADEPTDTHVQTSYKIKRRVHSLRRYAWNSRQLLQELRQDNFGVIPPETQKKMMSVERNAENMVEVAEAYMEQCSGIEDFYEGFQEKLQNATLYVLTITSVAIMPYQLLTGLYGMNFDNLGDDSSAQDPMLKFEYGYWVCFWGLGALLTAITVGWMHKKGILKSRSTSWTSAINESSLADEAKREEDLKRFRKGPPNPGQTSSVGAGADPSAATAGTSATAKFISPGAAAP
eukprot:SAG22_NODE_57_length_23647_cov_11.746688_13_plen_486_part_00